MAKTKKAAKAETKNPAGLVAWQTPSMEEALASAQAKYAELLELVATKEAAYRDEAAKDAPNGRRLQSLTSSLLANREELAWQGERLKILPRMMRDRDEYAVFAAQSEATRRVSKIDASTP